MTVRRYKGNEIGRTQEFEVQFVFNESPAPAVNILTVVYIHGTDEAGVFGSVIEAVAVEHISNVSPYLYDICLAADEVIINGELYEKGIAA